MSGQCPEREKFPCPLNTVVIHDCFCRGVTFRYYLYIEVCSIDVLEGGKSNFGFTKIALRGMYKGVPLYKRGHSVTFRYSICGADKHSTKGIIPLSQKRCAAASGIFGNITNNYVCMKKKVNHPLFYVRLFVTFRTQSSTYICCKIL